MPRWNRNSLDARALKKAFEDNVISLKAKPSDVYNGDDFPAFKRKYTFNQFRNAFNRMKAEVEKERDGAVPVVPPASNLGSDALVDSDTEDEDDLLATFRNNRRNDPTLVTPPARVSRSNEPPPIAQRTERGTGTASVGGVNGTMGDVGMGLGNVGTMGITDEVDPLAPIYFKPATMVTYFKNKNQKKHICVMFHLPSGLLDNEGYEKKIVLSIGDDKKRLVVKYLWPELMMDHQYIEQAMNEIKGSNERNTTNLVCSMEEEQLALKSLYGLSRFQAIPGITEIQLKYDVEREIVKVLPLKDSNTNAAVLIVILKQCVTEIVEQPKMMGVCVINRSVVEENDDMEVADF